MKILIASHNPAKVDDYGNSLKNEGIEVTSLKELKIEDKFEENKDTFEENAIDKAKYYYNLTKMPTLSEDGGIEIEALNGEPGVLSRRWLGYEASDEEIVECLKSKLPLLKDNNNARFVAVLAFVNEDSIKTFENSIAGYISSDLNSNYPEGFPYRALFKLKKYNKHFMDLTEEEYNNVNHRQKNINDILKYLK
ncbi:non-canonical purine NTP pyrophosphatase [bacterium]|jgi:XTP/dITP diphosphohydrolase|nr:non-canonical purine NTP pyrophosphatase [bacterium]MBT4335356.1 non-canonical purine NTP pyrophosphatase [bacterium]MBT4495755.1 non-canonical purine NTP pyrophosphatase [bacterium]MBT4764133.1 non-canonical purine NTP pyrophosphatase [bacterium]MBT5401505.1 non-canonical purine NTP pyrophosphatase [bacterium]